jgi:hypothetical protein
MSKSVTVPSVCARKMDADFGVSVLLVLYATVGSSKR